MNDTNTAEAIVAVLNTNGFLSEVVSGMGAGAVVVAGRVCRVRGRRLEMFGFFPVGMGRAFAALRAAGYEAI